MKNGSPQTWDTNRIANAAESNARLAGHSASDWQLAIERSLGRILGAELEPHFFERIVSSFESPDHLSWFSYELCILGKYQVSPKSFWQRLQQHLDSSQFSYNDWMSAFYQMKTWLDKNSAQAPLTDLFAYICCCEESLIAKGTQVDLSVALVDFLDSEGFQAARPFKK